MENVLQNEAVFDSEAAYTTDATPMEVLDFGSPTGSTDDEMLGALLALKNPSYWQNMMMPGFSWSEPRHHMTDPYPQQHQDFPGFYNGFDTTQPTGLTA